jgi:CO/xanthine dehydrogenase FAD-binding subunit
MKPSPFTYHRAASVDDAVAWLGRHEGDAKVLAGGQSLVPLMNFRLAAPAVLVDINSLHELSSIRRTNGTLTIGALTRQSAVEDSGLVAEACPLLLQATRLIGHRTVRNRGTVGGSMAHADPVAEYPATLVALDGEIVARGPDGERRIAARDFFLTVCMTSLGANELVTEVRVPVQPPGTGSAFLEQSRRHGDYAIVGVAAAVTVDEDGTCRDARLALAGVGGTPLRCDGAEAVLRGTRLEETAIAEAASSSAAAADPTDDLHATAQYKRAMVEVYVKRALRLARARTGRVVAH